MGLNLYFLLHTAMPCQQASELEDVADPLSTLVQVGHGLRNGSWIKRTLPEVRNTQPATKLAICPLRRSVVNLTSQPYQYRIARQKLEKLNSGFWQSCTFLHLRERECNRTAGIAFVLQTCDATSTSGNSSTAVQQIRRADLW